MALPSPSPLPSGLPVPCACGLPTGLRYVHKLAWETLADHCLPLGVEPRLGSSAAARRRGARPGPCSGGVSGAAARARRVDPSLGSIAAVRVANPRPAGVATITLQRIGRASNSKC